MPKQPSLTNTKSGLGALLSTTFASQGCNIAINYFNRIEPAQQVQKACEEKGVKAVIVKAVGLTLPIGLHWKQRSGDKRLTGLARI